jgi:CheY-like chemotaxis protein
MPSVGDPAQFNPSILCVDDDVAVREVVARALRTQFGKVETAADGLIAWERLAAAPKSTDLVITDNQMPGLTGVELVRKLRQAGFCGKVVFFSSTLGIRDAEEIAGLKVDAVIEKGCSLEVLLATIGEVLQLGKQGSEQTD